MTTIPVIPMQRLVPIAAAVAATVAAALAVIAAGLWVSLPDDTVVANWAPAWAGFDVVVAATALLTAVLLRRGDPRAALGAASASALLVADAWFDVTTSGGGALAVAEALAVELPLAVAGVTLALRILGPRVNHGVAQAPSRPAASRDDDLPESLLAVANR